MCVYSLSYPARNAHAPYCHLWPAPLYNIFPHYLINCTIFGKNVTKYKICIDFLHKFCLLHFSLKEEWSEIWPESSTVLHVKYPLFLSYFNETRIFLLGFRRILKYQISWKSVHLEPSSMWTDGRTDMTKLIVAFRSFADAPKTVQPAFYKKLATCFGQYGRH